MFTMENCFYLLISQAVRYLKDPAVHPRDKQRMKQELSSELVSRRASSVALRPLLKTPRRTRTAAHPIPGRAAPVLLRVLAVGPDSLLLLCWNMWLQ